MRPPSSRALVLTNGGSGDAGTNVGVKTERLSRGDVQALVSAPLRRGDRRLQEHASASQRLPGGGLDPRRDPPQVDLLADLDDLRRNSRAGSLQDLECRCHDLRADAIAVGHSNGNHLIAHVFACLDPPGMKAG